MSEFKKILSQLSENVISEYEDVTPEQFKDIVFSNFIEMVKNVKGRRSIDQTVDEYGFTGEFAGLGKYMSLSQLKDVLEQIL